MRVVAADHDLAPLWPAWEALWHRQAAPSPFTAPAWLRPWWQVFGTGQPCVAVLGEPPHLGGVLPLYRLGDKMLPMGVGISDMFDVLLAPASAPDAVPRLIAGALAATDVARCDVPELPPQARLLEAASPPGWRVEHWDGPVCPVLSLMPEPAIPKGMRRDLRQARHRATRAGGWRIERAAAHTVGALMEQLITLHTARWQGRAQLGVLTDPQVLAFHQVAAPALLAAGLLRLEVLSLRGRPAAAIHALLAPDRICFYLAGFDPAAAFESPGTILLGHMIEEAAREGRREAHFLRGDEAYKYAWGGIDRRNRGLSFVRA